MKTTTKFYALLLAAGCMMAGFTACTEEPEPDPFVNDTGGGGIGNIGGGNDGDDEEEELTFRVTSFTYADEYGLPDGDGLTTFYYDTAGRLAGGDFYNGGCRFYISYDRSGEPQRLELRFATASPSIVVLENFQLNAQGYVTSVEYTDDVNGTGNCTGLYDAEGHLLGWAIVTFLDYELTINDAYAYTWNGNNLVEMSYTYDVISSDSDTYEFVYAPSAKRNPAQGVPWFTSLREPYEITILRYAGLLGTTSRDIPTNINYKTTYLEDWNDMATLHSGYNSNGSLSWIRLTSENSSVAETILFGYDGNGPGQY